MGEFLFSNFTVFSNFSSGYIFVFHGDIHDKLCYQDTTIRNTLKIKMKV